MSIFRLVVLNFKADEVVCQKSSCSVLSKSGLETRKCGLTFAGCRRRFTLFTGVSRMST